VLDPQERHNFADDPDHAELLRDMQRRLERWMAETDDPLRHGTRPAPEGLGLNVNR